MATRVARLPSALRELAHQRDVGERIARSLAGTAWGSSPRRDAPRAPPRGGPPRAAESRGTPRPRTLRERCFGLRLRGHAAAEGFAAGDKRKLGHEPCRFRHRGAHRGLRKLRRIGALAALLHIGELIAKRGDAAFGKPVGDCRHEGMGHAGAGAMGEHVAERVRLRGTCKQTRDALRLIDGDGHGLRRHGSQDGAATA